MLPSLVVSLAFECAHCCAAKRNIAQMRGAYLGRHPGDGVHVVTGLYEEIIVFLESEISEPRVENLVLLMRRRKRRNQGRRRDEQQDKNRQQK